MPSRTSLLMAFTGGFSTVTTAICGGFFSFSRTIMFRSNSEGKPEMEQWKNGGGNSHRLRDQWLLDQGSTRHTAENIVIRERALQVPPRQPGVLSHKALRARAFAILNGFENRAMLVLSNGEHL